MYLIENERIMYSENTSKMRQNRSLTYCLVIKGIVANTNKGFGNQCISNMYVLPLNIHHKKD